MTNKGTQTLTTERLLLRPFRMDDAEAMFQNWASDPLVTRFLTWPPHPDVETSRGILRIWVDQYADDRVYNWLIERGGAPIGGISVVQLDCANENAEIGYCIGRAHWGQGVMSEALARVLDFLFGEVGLHRVHLKHDVLNPGSGRVMIKNGLTLEGTQREHFLRKDGTWADMAVYGILKDEWGQRKGDTSPLR